MSKKSKSERSAPEVLSGESYSPLPSSHPFVAIVCTDCSRYLMDNEAIWRHVREGHRVKYFGRDKYEKKMGTMDMKLRG